MPDYDLGTAHGNIRIDSESRGVDNANRSLDGFSRALGSIRSRLGGFNASMNSIEDQLRQVSRDFQEAKASADDFSRSADGTVGPQNRASRSTRQWTGDLAALHERLRGVSEVAATFAPVGAQVGRFAKELHSFKGSDASNLTRVATSLYRIGAASTVLSLVKGHFMGIGAALAMAPQWAQGIVRTANSFRLLTFGVGLMTRFDLAGRAWLATARLVGRASADAGMGMLKFGDAVEKAIQPLMPAINWIKRFNNSVDGMAGSAVEAIAGFSLLRSGLSGLSRNFGLLTGNIRTGNYWMDLAAKTLRFMLLPGALLSSVALQGLGQALIFTSNLFVGLWNGIKQLSGGLLALPGGLMMIGAAAGTLIPIVSNLKNSFKDLLKDVGKDPAKVADDIAALPPYLRGLGQALVDVVPKWKDFQNTLTATFVSGAEDQLRQLVSGYLPAISNGAIQVANSWRIAKDQVLAFASQSQTVSAVSMVFQNTAQAMNSLSSNIQPALEGLRDIGVTGTTFLRNWVEDYLPSLISKFQQWAQVNQQNGNLMTWMENSVRGVRDLYHGLEDTTKMLWTFLTLFKTNSGDNFLARFAAEMHKLNGEVSNSAATGFLHKLGDSVRGLGTDKIHELISIFKAAVPTLQQFMQMFGEISRILNAVVVPSFEAVMQVVGAFVAALNALGGGYIIGTIMSIGAAFKIWSVVLGPILNLIKVISGIMMGWAGLEGIVLGLGTALENFGSIGQKAADKIVGGFANIQSKLSMFAGIIGGVVIAWSVYQQGAQEINNANKAIAQSSQDAQAYVGNLRKAFMQDGGLAGHNVFDTMKSSMDTFMADLQNQAQAAPGFAAHITDWLRGGNQQSALKDVKAPDWLQKIIQGVPIVGSYLNMPTGNSKELDQATAAADAAGKAQQALQKLNITTQDLAQAASGPQDGYNKLHDVLMHAGDGGVQAAQKLQFFRDQYLQVQRDMAAAGPGAIQLAQGIQKIGDAGGDAQTKLDGLKLALEGLGLLKTDAYQAAFAYAQAVQGLGDAAAKAADPTQSFTDIIDAQTGLLNTNSVNARNLFNVLQPLSETFLSAAAHGKNVNDLWQQMSPQLQQVADSFHLTKDQVIGLIQQLGVVPKTVGILVQLQGKDKISQEIAQVIATAQSNLGNQKPIQIPIGVDAQKVADEVNKALGLVGKSNAVGVQGGNVVLGTNINQAAVDALLKAAAQNHGITDPGGPAAQPGPTPVATAPAPAPPAPEAAPPPPPKKGEPGYVPPPEPAKPLKLPPGMPAPVGDTVGNAAATTPPVASAPAPVAAAPAPAAPAPAAPPPVPAQVHTNVVVDGMPQFLGGMAQMNGAIDGVIGKWNAFKTGIAQAMGDGMNAINNFVNQALGKLNQSGTDATKSGNAFAMDFANGIAAKSDAVAVAASGLAKTAAAFMPHSPAEKGPLSGEGWSGFSGKKFSLDFAAGVSSGVSNISESVKTAAAAAKTVFAGLTKGVPDTGSAFGKQFKDVLNLVNSGFKIFNTQASNLLKFGKTVSGLMGPEGTFFGNVLPFIRDPKISDADLAAKNAKAAGQGAAGVGNALLGGAQSIANIPKPSKDDIAAAIAGEAQARGYDRNTAIAVIAAAMHESGMDPTQVNASGHESLFQTSADKGVGTNAANQISWMFNQLDALGGPSKAAADPLDLIASQIEKGGYTGAALGQHANAAASLYDTALKSAASVGANTTPYGGGPYAANPASQASRVSDAPNVEAGIRAAGIAPLYQPGSTTPPAWMQQLAQSFGLTASTYGDGGSLHQMGFAADFNGPEAGRRQLAQYLSTALASQTLQLIYQDPQSGAKYGIASGHQVGPGTSEPGYYADDFGQHTDHVHWATDVAPILAGANANAMPVASGAQPTNLTPDSLNPLNAGLSQLAESNDNLPAGAQPGQPIPPGPTQPGMPTRNAPLTNAQASDNNNQVLSQLRSNNTDLNSAIATGQNPNATDAQVAQSLGVIQTEINKQTAAGDQQSKEQADALNGVKEQIASSRGMTQSKSPLDSAQSMMSGMSSIVNDVVQDINSFMDAMAATKNSADILVRGIANTGDINKLIDNGQKWLTFASQVAQTVGDVANEVGSFIPSSAGGADFGGTAAAKEAVQAVSGIADLVSGVIQGINAGIDLAQQAEQVAGSYFGNFLGYLTGGANSLEGNVQFLLDQNTGQLLAYSTDNPLERQAHDLPGQVVNPNGNNQGIGQINVYGGPGSDPRDNTRQMMYQIKAAGYATATAQ